MNLQKIFLYIFLALLGIYFVSGYIARLSFVEEDTSSIIRAVNFAIYLLAVSYLLFNFPVKRDNFLNVIIAWGIWLLISNIFRADSIFDFFILSYHLIIWPITILLFYVFAWKTKSSYNAVVYFYFIGISL